MADVSAIPIGASNKKLALEFLNFRLDPETQRDFCLGYFASPARPDLTDWPADFVETQITTQAKMNQLDLPDSKRCGPGRDRGGEGDKIALGESGDGAAVRGDRKHGCGGGRVGERLRNADKDRSAHSRGAKQRHCPRRMPSDCS